MSYIPVIPTGGIAGWSYLQRTREVQQETFGSTGKVERDVEYFEANIGKVKTAEDLMKDYRLLSVALGAFGLDEDINSRFFIRKVLEEGTLAEDALANKLSDKRYNAMAQAFGFDLTPPKTQVSDFGPKITKAYTERQFEVAVGEQDGDMRLAMGFERELATVVKDAKSVDSMWFNIMATRPLRQVFEKAFSLPIAVGTLDVDRQLEIFKSKSAAMFGSSDPAQFTKPEKREELTRQFLVRSDLENFASGYSGASAALMLLQSGSGGLF